MSLDTWNGPVTYPEVFGMPAAQLEGQAVTREDASLMQSAETLALGQTQKGGAASAMQGAAETNVKEGLVPADAHSSVAEAGVSVAKIIMPGVEMNTIFVAGEAVAGSMKPLPTSPELAAEEAVTIGEALEAAAVGSGDRPIGPGDARAILSAETRATGIIGGSKGGLGAMAQSAAELNPRVGDNEKTTVADVLMDATIELPMDKVVTQIDAAKVLDAEVRNSPTGKPEPGGVAVAVQAAADLNVRAGIVAPSAGHPARAFPMENKPYLPFGPEGVQPDDTDNVTKDNGADEVSKTVPVPPTDSEKVVKPHDADKAAVSDV